MHDTSPSRKGPDKTRLAWLDVAKGFSIVLVVLHHSYLFVDGQPFSWHGLEITDMVLPLFFLAAGLTTAFGLHLGLVDYLLRRVVPILWLYLLWTIIYGLFNEHVAVLFPWVNGGHTVSVLHAATWPWGNLWFVWVLLVACLLVRPLAKFPRIAVLSVSIALAALFSIGAGASLPGNVRSLALFLPFFLAGALWPLALKQVASSPRAITIMIGTSFLALAAIACFPSISDALPLPRLIAGTGLGLGLSILLTQSLLTRSVAGYCGQRSLAIFLGHQMFLAVIFAFAPASAHGWPSIILASIAAVVLSLLLFEGLMHIGLRWVYEVPALIFRKHTGDNSRNV